jgi:chemotaxis protein MotA
LAIKLESRNDDEFIIKTLILQAALSMARKENPRRLELILNTTLAPQNRISYF